MILSLLTTFLTATSSYYVYGNVRNYNQQSARNYIVTDFAMYESQTDLNDLNSSTNKYAWNYSNTIGNQYDVHETITYRSNFLVTSTTNDTFGIFNAFGRVPDEVIATYTDLTSADESLYDLHLSFHDEDYGNNSVLTFYPNIKNYLTNCVIDYHFDFFMVYSDGSFEYYEYSSYDFSIPLWVQNYGGESVFSLNGNLDELITQVWNADDERSLVCTYSVSFGIVDMQTIHDYWYNQGYYQGKEDGYALGGGNDFQKILGTIIDTPILYLRKFFGYEVFGVNLYGAIATIMSLIVALAVFRMIRSFI